MKRTLTAFISLLACMCMLFSCSGGGDAQTQDTQGTPSSDSTADTTPDVTPTVPDGILIASPEGTEFKMIVPTGAKRVFTTCTEIKGEIYGIAHKNVFVKYDGSEKESQYEILFGQTNREESKLVCEGLGADEYHIKWVGDKLVVGAGSNYAAHAGAVWLWNNHIKGVQGDSLYISADIDHKGKTNVNTTFENLKDGWNALVYPAENGIELLYQIYMPDNYDKTKDYPCILYMHSAGVRCDDNSHIYTGEAKFLRNFESSKYADEAIIIAPCCPKTDRWVPALAWNQITYDFVNTSPTEYMSAATELFSKARSILSIDDSRLYLYGMSMGGFATWDLLTRNPDLFAAAIPVAGAGDPSAVATFADTAIWIFHGTADTTVPFESGQKMYDALTAAGRDDVKFTVFEGAGHGIWSMTADTEGLFDWLFSQKKD